MLDAPFSLEALKLARRAAAAKYRYPDDRLAVSDLLARWSMGLGMDRAERRMALRIAREQAEVELPYMGNGQPADQLASVRKVLQAHEAPAEGEELLRAAPRDGEAGDDDDPDELDFVSRSAVADRGPAGDFDEGFYATAIKEIDD